MAMDLLLYITELKNANYVHALSLILKLCTSPLGNTFTLLDRKFVMIIFNLYNY